jgi:Na+/proline symporter
LLTCPHISCFRRFATGFLRHKYDSPTLGVIVSLVGIVTLISYLVLRL